MHPHRYAQFRKMLVKMNHLLIYKNKKKSLMKKHFHTYKKIISLLPLLLLGFVASVQGQAEEQFEFKLQYMEEGNDSLWGVYVRPLAGFETGRNDAVVGSGQITVLMRNNGLDSIHNIQSVSGRWNNFYDIVKGPTEATNISYLFIGCLLYTSDAADE